MVLCLCHAMPGAVGAADVADAFAAWKAEHGKTYESAVRRGEKEEREDGKERENEKSIFLFSPFCFLHLLSTFERDSPSAGPSPSPSPPSFFRRRRRRSGARTMPAAWRTWKPTTRRLHAASTRLRWP